MEEKESDDAVIDTCKNKEGRRFCNKRIEEIGEEEREIEE